MKRDTGKKFYQQLDKKPVTRKSRLQEAWEQEMRQDEKRKGPKTGVFRTAEERPLRTNEVRGPRTPRTGPPREGSPRSGSPRSGAPRTGGPREGGPRDASFRTGPRDGSVREGNSRDTGLRNGPRDGSLRAGGPRTGAPRSGPRTGAFSPGAESGTGRPPRTPRTGTPFSNAVRTAPRPHTEDLRLNRYIAQSGVCSRRDADTLISGGRIKVNGEVVRELGYKVRPGKDKVEYDGKSIRPQNFVYLLLNKPKNYITTMDDPEGRNTVMQLITEATNERIYPVGRLDRNTTGLLLMTNDGEMAERLMHPSHRVRKIYAVRLDRDFATEDMEKLLQGVELEDGIAQVDKISYIDGRPMNEIGVEIHLGKNRIVRRLFEHLGYTVEALDRTLIGSLTKKLLPRGKWRMLTEQEVAFLKML